jgi:hypothetical protein
MYMADIVLRPPAHRHERQARSVRLDIWAMPLKPVGPQKGFDLVYGLQENFATAFS